MSLPLPEHITLSQGGGGRDMTRLLDEVILPAFGMNPGQAGDSAFLAKQDFKGESIAFTHDAFTVDPLEFAGGNIGTLAVNGTVNDLAVSGATPVALSCALIIREGFSLELLKRLLDSMATAARAAKVNIVTGDTKVVHREAADGLFITTSGIGSRSGAALKISAIEDGDVLLVSGPIGDHGAAILAARGDLKLEVPVASDCRPLILACQALQTACPELRYMRDATRGGVAAVAQELAKGSGCGLQLDESAMPLRPAVRGACEILGLDALHFANEGTFLAVLPAAAVETAISAMRQADPACEPVVVGRFSRGTPARVTLLTRFGIERGLEPAAGELLPRIC